MSTDTATVRAGEELDREALTSYLKDKIEGGERVVIEQFPGGHSNLTYLLRTPVREYVLRRGPLGPVAPKAHDMVREYRVLRAVHPFFPAAPEVFHLCEDASVIGAVFFVMERRRGIVVRDHIPAELAAFPDYPARVSTALIDCLSDLHAIDIRKQGLDLLGRPEGFLERQVRGWFERWNRAKTEEIPAMDRLITWLQERLHAYFSGVVWVDTQDLVIVKTLGKWVTETGDITAAKLPFTVFETYRQQVGQNYWFPAYSRSDEYVPSGDGSIPIRIVVKWSDFTPVANTPAADSPAAKPPDNKGTP